jgi:hypothetical protein
MDQIRCPLALFDTAGELALLPNLFSAIEPVCSLLDKQWLNLAAMDTTSGRILQQFHSIPAGRPNPIESMMFTGFKPPEVSTPASINAFILSGLERHKGCCGAFPSTLWIHSNFKHSYFSPHHAEAFAQWEQSLSPALREGLATMEISLILPEDARRERAFDWVADLSTALRAQTAPRLVSMTEIKAILEARTLADCAMQPSTPKHDEPAPRL